MTCESCLNHLLWYAEHEGKVRQPGDYRGVLAEHVTSWGAQAVSLDEEDLAREFSGAVRLTVHVQEEVTLTPEQASPLVLPSASSSAALTCESLIVANLDDDREEQARSTAFTACLKDSCLYISRVDLLSLQIRKMTDRDIARLWSQYVKDLAVLLVWLFDAIGFDST